MISQEEYSPEDPANPCMNYPTEEYESYADCDDQFVRSFLPPGLKPFWTVDNISEATNSFFLDAELYSKIHSYLGLSSFTFCILRLATFSVDLYSGLKVSSCLQPCLRQTTALLLVEILQDTVI